ncbi:hypothetical protein BC830DRAFT_277951 [Chytriomyces sp. MP71]|nr:hypothetical protein BC830DRAFT_277951 [Chytriomyces sp. MP71]
MWSTQNSTRTKKRYHLRLISSNSSLPNLSKRFKTRKRKKTNSNVSLTTRMPTASGKRRNTTLLSKKEYVQLSNLRKELTMLGLSEGHSWNSTHPSQRRDFPTLRENQDPGIHTQQGRNPIPRKTGRHSCAETGNQKSPQRKSDPANRDTKRGGTQE